MGDRYPLRRFRINIILLVGVVAFGTAGYMLAEGWGPVDALFMTIITIAAVGYKEVHPLDSVGQVFTMVLIVSGIGLMAYTFVQFVELVVGGHLADEWRTRQMKRQIEGMKDHYIICGLGEVGEQVAEELHRMSMSFVVVDQRPDLKDACRERGWLYVQKTGIEEEALREAGIDRARGLIASIHDDTANIYIMITARALNPSLHLIARVNMVENLNLVKRSGADDIISVPRLAGVALADVALNGGTNNYHTHAEGSTVGTILTAEKK